MAFRENIDLRRAMNAISDVVENRPRPLREFDQIYMKSGDMLRQSEIVASWANGKDLAFIGDGDGISLAVAHLQALDIFDFGPARIRVFDFDERIVNSIARFAERQRLGNIDSKLYNCVDPFPETGEFDLFYTNPPWGQNNDGESVAVFAERGMEAVGSQGHGMVIIADSNDPEITWTRRVLFNTQVFTASKFFFVSRMMTREHLYHLHDEHSGVPSCNLVLSSHPDNERKIKSSTLSQERKKNFYGREQALRVRFIKEVPRLDYGRANDAEYRLEFLNEEDL